MEYTWIRNSLIGIILLVIIDKTAYGQSSSPHTIQSTPFHLGSIHNVRLTPLGFASHNLSNLSLTWKVSGLSNIDTYFTVSFWQQNIPESKVSVLTNTSSVRNITVKTDVFYNLQIKLTEENETSSSISTIPMMFTVINGQIEAHYQDFEHCSFSTSVFYGLIGLLIILVLLQLVFIFICYHYRTLAQKREHGTAAKSHCPQNAYQGLNLPELSASLNSNMSHVYQSIKLEESGNMTQSEVGNKESRKIYSVHTSLGSAHEYTELTASLSRNTLNSTGEMFEEIPAVTEKENPEGGS
ncbi:uncharacterized protein LOC144623994 [Crassostrea virginica]